MRSELAARALLVGTLSVAGASCTTTRTEMAALNTATALANLDDYEVVGEVEGTGRVNWLLFIPLNAPGDTGTLYGLPTPGWLFGGRLGELGAREKAMRAAIQQIADADALLLPRFEIERTDYVLFSTVEVKVRAKAVRVRGVVRRF